IICSVVNKYEHRVTATVRPARGGLKAVAQVSLGVVLARLAEAPGVHVKSARGAVSGWPLWDLPRWLQVRVRGAAALYLGAVAGAVAFAHVEAKQLWLFGLLLACGAVSVELTRRAGQTGGVVRGVYAIWDLPVPLAR